MPDFIFILDFLLFLFELENVLPLVFRDIPGSIYCLETGKLWSPGGITSCPMHIIRGDEFGKGSVPGALVTREDLDLLNGMHVCVKMRYQHFSKYFFCAKGLLSDSCS